MLSRSDNGTVENPPLAGLSLSGDLLIDDNVDVLFIQLHEHGFATVKESTLTLRRMKGGSLWFPEKSRLLVDVEVTERATGEKGVAVDSSCQFTSSPYMIEFKNTAKYFKPGLRFVVKVLYSLEGILASQ